MRNEKTRWAVNKMVPLKDKSGDATPVCTLHQLTLTTTDDWHSWRVSIILSTCRVIISLN